MAVLFLSAMIGLVYSSNLILLYIFWEITAVTSWRLIGFFRQPSDVVKADKSFLVTVFGALLMLAGFIMLYMQAGSFDLVSIKTAAAAKPVSSLAIALILVGIFSKSATLPFHTWLPDAGVAPSPVTALLHAAVLVKIGVYVFARIFIVTLTLPPQWRTAVLGVAAASAIVSGCAALVDTNLKRIIAYSTVSQIAFIFMGLTAGGEAAVYGALLYILMHGLAKGGLFLCAGIVEQNTHTKDITRLGGLIRTMPVTALSFLLCAFSVMGIPPFGGFFSKYLIFSGAILAGRFRISLLFLAGAFLTMGYLSRAFGRVFLGEPKIEAAEGSQVMVICVAFLAALSLAAGVFIFYLGPPVQTVAWQMMGIAQ
jgi:NADH:ubiquinone oxidoreductase subunit 5 (subunit L)/multisubunit Na+/H+ antiporter MnhA subunit